jgi:hypothetical protein
MEPEDLNIKVESWIEGEVARIDHLEPEVL